MNCVPLWNFSFFVHHEKSSSEIQMGSPFYNADLSPHNLHIFRLMKNELAMIQHHSHNEVNNATSQ